MGYSLRVCKASNIKHSASTSPTVDIVTFLLEKSMIKIGSSRYNIWPMMAPHSSTLAWKIPWTEEAAVHGVAKNQTRLSDFPFTFHFHTLEKEMATHSSVLAWKTPGTGEAGGFPSMGSHRVGHN